MELVLAIGLFCHSGRAAERAQNLRWRCYVPNHGVGYARCARASWTESERRKTSRVLAGGGKADYRIIV